MKSLETRTQMKESRVKSKNKNFPCGMLVFDEWTEENELVKENWRRQPERQDESQNFRVLMEIEEWGEMLTA